MKQLSLIPAPKLAHGGELNRGFRKPLRPLASDRPIHLILKAKSTFSGFEGAFVLSETYRLAEKFSVKTLDHAVAGDHVHLVLKIPQRQAYLKFIRSLTGLLARKFGKGYWQQLPFTRVASWGRDFRSLGKYLERNRLEAAGLLAYGDRFYKENEFFAR